MADVFISYRQTDRERVTRIADLLKFEKFSVWFDSNLRVGDQGGFDAEIEREVCSAAAVLVCWTPDSIKSLYVRAEAKKGLERKCMVPIFLTRSTLPVPFNDIHTLDFSAWHGSREALVFQELVKALAIHQAKFTGELVKKCAQSAHEIESLPIPQYPGALGALLQKLIRLDTGPTRYHEMGLYARDAQACADWLLRLLRDERDAIAEWHSEATQYGAKGADKAEDAWDYFIQNGEMGKRRRSELAHMKSVLKQLVEIVNDSEDLFQRRSRP